MDLRKEDILLQLRDQLKKDQVKLWLPPYTVNDQSSENNQEDKAFRELIGKYSSLLNIDETLCGTILRELKYHALMRLKEREVFSQTGLATIQVRVSGDEPQTLTIQVLLDETAAQLIDKIAEKIEVAIDSIKLISGGKVLENSKDLASQAVKNGIQIMAVILSWNLSALQEFRKMPNTLEITKNDLEYLGIRSNLDDAKYYFFDWEDKSGKQLLPSEERNALIMGMTLHKKGKAALKQDNYGLALVLLLQADEKYSVCNSAFLPNMVNCDLLYLDEAWCYLCLQNFTQNPDAEAKLKQCEANFHARYGPNLEMLMALKGPTGNITGLFIRLHLLQGVVLYYQNKREEAKRLFERANNELSALKRIMNVLINERLSTLIKLGISPAEARLVLYEINGGIEAADNLIRRKRSQKKLGKCADGEQWVEIESVKKLVEMGYSYNLAAAALKYTNNKISDAVQAIQDIPHILTAAIENPVISSEMINHVIEMGFDRRMAKIALRKHKGNVESAVEELTAFGGIIEDDISDNSDEETEEQAKQCKKEEKAFDMLSEGADDYLDLTLVQVEKFLNEYLSLIC